MKKPINRSQIECLILLIMVLGWFLASSYPAQAARGVGESNTFPIDTLTSVLPSCPTHPDSSRWYNHNDPALSWTTPFIAPAGYYFILDQDLSTQPTDTTGQYLLDTQLALKDQPDGTWYLHVTAELDTGELEPNVAHYQINIDTAPPEVTSTSHPDQSQWYQARQAELSWTTLHPSSAANFYYILDNEENTVPTASTGTVTQETQMLSAVSDGRWYFHIVWADLAGSVGEKAAHYAMNVDDTAPPAITNLTATEQPNTDILLIWADSIDPASGVDYYQVYRSETQEVIGRKLSTDGEVTTGRYVDVGATDLDKVLYYTVLPVDRAGNKQTEGVQKPAGLTQTLPTADPQSVTTDEDTPVAIILTGSDPDGNALTFRITVQPSYGSLSETVPNVTYTPNPGFSGADSFTFVVNDGAVDSEPATVNIMVNPAAPLPTADLVVSALETGMAADAGGFATYLIKLEGKNGFDAVVTLFDSGLPLNVGAKFAPETVALSAAEPLDTSQLTLTLPTDIPSGDYLFTFLAIPEGGEAKQLTLTLTVNVKEEQAATSLTLILQPIEVPFMGQLSLLGQLASLADIPVELGDAIVQITFTLPSGKTQTFEIRTDAEGSYQLAAPFSPDEVGEWSVKALFEGNAQLKSSQRERAFTVTKGYAEIVFDTGTVGALGTEVMLLGHLEPQLEGTLLTLKILRPDGSASTLTGITTEASGVFRHTLKLEIAGDWEFTATWPGSDQYEGVERTLVLSVSEEIGKAILVLGGGNRQDNPDWTTFNRVVEYVHSVFLRRNFDDEEDIYFLSPDPGVTEGADNVTSLTALEFAITGWAAERVNAQVPLYLYLLSHNLGESFLLEKRGNQEIYLTPAQLDSWLNQLPGDTPVTIITEACHSGNFIRTSDGQPAALVDTNRTIIVSARGDKQAKILRNRSSFSKAFFDGIGANKTVGEAFSDATDLMKRIPFHRDQFPQMDADGDGNVNTPQDYVELSHRYLPADLVSLAAPPNIIDITPSQTLPEGVSSLRIRVELLGVDITHVFATVIPPDFDPTQQISDWSALEFPEFDLAEIPVDDSKHEYAATYGNFTIPGAYTVIVNAENPDGSAVPVQTTVTVLVGAVVKGDVNNDGRIRSNDAILVLRMAAGLMTPTDYQRSAADMNSDGKIRSNDAILILRVAAGLAASGGSVGGRILYSPKS